MYLRDRQRCGAKRARVGGDRLVGGIAVSADDHKMARARRERDGERGRGVAVSHGSAAGQGPHGAFDPPSAGVERLILQLLPRSQRRLLSCPRRTI